MNEKGIWLPQSEAALSLGVGISKFISGYRIQITLLNPKRYRKSSKRLNICHRR